MWEPGHDGFSASRCRHCGRGTSRVAMRGSSSLCVRCATVAVANGVSQVSQRRHAGVLERHIILTERHVRHVVTCGISLCEGLPSDTLLTERITHRLRLLVRSHLAVDDAATSAMLGPS